MGKCKYCGESAGWFSYRHTACEDAFNQAQADFTRTLAEPLTVESAANLKAIAAAGRLSDDWVRPTALTGLRTALDRLLDDGLLSEAEQEQLDGFREAMGFDIESADIQGYRHKLFRAQSLRMLLEGEDPSVHFAYEGMLPVLLMKSEKLLYLFKGVEFWEERTRTTYEGRSSGVSLRIAKGVYYRTGGFRGNPVKETGLEHIDTGIFVVTDTHVYFHGPSKSFRTRYSKMVGVDPYEDGVGIRKDGTTARPQVFSGLDGWYVYNVIRHFAP